MYNIMNFYQSVSPEKKKNFQKYSGKAGFWVITLQYLPFLVRAVPPKLFFLNLDYI